ncbi:MAG: Gfo/Idh/MocA family oxidoreductase [Chloroflexi bacterium]|nr:Gfo/Idh/MocA family oxidoreductase [Chloroflexota bacterium]
MTEEQPLRLGIVGANPTQGWAPRTHLPAIVGLPEYELTAVCTTKEESARASAEKFDAGKAYWSHQDLASDPDIDIVDVCVRVPYHHEIVMAALEAGKHVYCEWPLGASTEQAREMANLANARGVHTMVGLQSRGSPSLLRLEQLVHGGYIGKVLAVTMTHLAGGLLTPRTPDALWRADRRSGANTMTIAGGHSLDVITWVVSPFVEVAANVATVAPDWPLEAGGTFAADAPDHVSLTGRLANGAIATALIASVPHNAPGFELRIYGTQGTLVASGGQAQTLPVRIQGARRGGELADVEIPEHFRWAPESVPEGTPVHVAQLLSRLSEGIRGGSPPAPTFDDAVKNHELLDAIQRSSETKAAVKIG